MATKSPPTAAPDEGIPSDIRKVIKKTVLDLRKRLEDDFTRQLAAWGVSTRGVSDSAPALNDADARAREIAVAVIERERVVAGRSLEEAIEFFVGECAFTFINRAFGLRCLEERGLLIVDGQTETAIRTDPARGSSSLYWRARNAPGALSDPRELWRETYRRACVAASAQVHVLFDPQAEEAALFPLLPTMQAVVAALNDSSIPPDTHATDELLGWVYQYFNSERKDEVFAAAGKGKKIEGEDIVPATQIYTERYMVDFLLQNSLGRLYREMYPDTRLPRWPLELTPHPDNPDVKREAKPLADITIMDPAVGSGHFLLRAADLLFQMYEEQHPTMSRTDVALSIIENNLYGIDLDLRAVQIAALALFMKVSTYAGRPLTPRHINLVPGDVQLAPTPSKEYLKRFQGDPQMEGLVNAIWESLRNVRELGSLIHPERAINEVIEHRRKSAPIEMQDESHWERWRSDLLAGLREQLSENGDADVDQRLLGEQTERGLTLVEALSRQYDVVCANPPYMGSKNMGTVLKEFVQKQYPSGKRDLYACFILRCHELARSNSYVAMVTQQSWMFLSSYAPLRNAPVENLPGGSGVGGLLRTSTVEQIVHLGPSAFQEVSGEVVNCVLVIFRTSRPLDEHQMLAVRLVGLGVGSEKGVHIARAASQEEPSHTYRILQSDLLSVPNAPFLYWISPELLVMLRSLPKLSTLVTVRDGISSGGTERALRFFWEVADRTRWRKYEKGGGFSRWFGLSNYVIDWSGEGDVVRAQRGGYIRNPDFFLKPGLVYSRMAQGSLGARVMTDAIFDTATRAVFPLHTTVRMNYVLGLLNSRTSSYFLRLMVQGYDFSGGYTENLPIPTTQSTIVDRFAIDATAVKTHIVSRDPTELGFFDAALDAEDELEASGALLHLLEAACEERVMQDYGMSATACDAVFGEMGRPSGRYVLLKGYDEVPQTFAFGEIVSRARQYLQEVPRQELAPRALASLKDRLRATYTSANRSANLADTNEQEDTSDGDDDSEPLGVDARVPMPSETFIDRLSQDLQLHPVSVYRLLEQMRTEERMVSPSQMRRFAEDFLSVKLLRLLGYRWPMQATFEQERGSPFLDPKWIDDDGIVPLTIGASQNPVGTRIRDILQDELGDDAEGEIGLTLGWKSGDEWGKQAPISLERWYEREFFKRHVQQFKQRPIAWHLKSPEGHFQAFILYHRLSLDTLRKLRSTYAGARIQQLKAEQERAKSAKNDKEVIALQGMIEDVELFRDTIEKIERGDELKYRIRCRWKDEEKDGRPGPYAPDIDDGVKVNIRPFQEAGLLAAKVINKW